MSWVFGKFKLNKFSVGLLASLKLWRSGPAEALAKAGFTMLELLVVISIFLVITGVVIADIPSFRTKSSLDLITSEVATYVRGAQVYGATQKGGGVGEDNVSYGIRFNVDSPDFFLFKNTFNSVTESYNINGFKITKIVANGGDPTSIDIIFKANDYTSSIGTQLEPEFLVGGTAQSFATVDIEIRPDRDATLCKAVRVYGNGQIAIAECTIP